MPITWSCARRTLTGAHREDGIDVRSVGRLTQPSHTVGAPVRRVDETRLRQAVDLYDSLVDLFADDQQARIRRAVHAFYRAIQERDAKEKLHQFLRVVEGFVFPDTGNTGRRLRSRTELFIGPGHHPRVTLWFEARSAIEHLNDVDDVFPGASVRERRLALLRNAVEVEALARYCLNRFFLRRDLWAWYESDQRIEDFWALDPADRLTLWGDPLDIAAVSREFDPRFIDDHDLGL